MKKTALVFVLLSAALCLFAQNGTIRDISGIVELKAAGASEYVTARSGDLVRQDTIISTGFKSTALVEVGSAVISVRPLTRLSLTEIRASSGIETINVNLQAGRVRVDVNPPAGTKASMSVVSPSATASVRGTSFEFDTRNLSVHSGTVSFQGNRGRTMMVNAGSVSKVESDGKAADPIETKSAGLLPPAPVGLDTVSAPAPEVRSSGTFNISINYPSVN